MQRKKNIYLSCVAGAALFLPGLGVEPTQFCRCRLRDRLQSPVPVDKSPPPKKKIMPSSLAPVVFKDLQSEITFSFVQVYGGWEPHPL